MTNDLFVSKLIDYIYEIRKPLIRYNGSHETIVRLTNLFDLPIANYVELKKIAKTRTKEEIVNKLESNSTFSALAKYFREAKRPLILGDLAKSLGYDGTNFIDTDLEHFVKAFCLPYDYSFCSNWEYYKNNFVFPTFTTSLLLNLLYCENTFNLEEVEKPEKYFSNLEMAEDTFSHFSKIRGQYYSIDKMKESEIKGKPNIEHLMAEDYGMQKDRLYLSSLSYYFRSTQNTAKNDTIYNFASDWEGETKSNIECDIALKFLKLKKSLFKEYDTSPTIPAYFRTSFYELASYMESGKWYKASSLYENYRKNFAPIQMEEDPWPWYYSSYEIDEVIGSEKEDLPSWWYEQENPNLYPYTDEIFRRAVFFSWIYLFSLLGVFDIEEREPELKLMKGKKRLPFSPYECLYAVSITEFGRWALDFVEEKPEIQKEFTAPVADKDLLLITYKGKDFDIKDYLNKIASPLGDIRYKVTLETFNRGNSTPSECKKQIDNFKKYITADIPENWNKFFEYALDSYVVTDRISTGTLIKVQNENAFTNLLKTTNIANLLIRCEGGTYYLSQENAKEFDAILKKHGFMRPIRSKDSQKRETI